MMFERYMGAVVGVNPPFDLRLAVGVKGPELEASPTLPEVDDGIVANAINPGFYGQVQQILDRPSVK